MNPPLAPVRFDEALDRALALLRGSGLSNTHAVLVRDLYGRIHLALDDRPPYAAPSPEAREHILQQLVRELGAFGPSPEEHGFLLASQFIDPKAIFESPHILLMEDKPLRISLLERQVTGSDWLRPPSPRNGTATAARVTMFSIKGGVGRSTAAAVWAQRLAEKSKRVLIIDLDLESPGIGSLLVPTEEQPELGVIDWLVEDAVGQANRKLLEALVARSPLAAATSGEILVISAGGRPKPGYDYLAKLSRAYIPVGSENGLLEFGDRIENFVRAVEEVHQPDLTILDSRAGLHDIAAAAITRLDATCFLFAGNNRQTWSDYSLLFQKWRAYPAYTTALRERLQMVAALIPEAGAEAYLERFRQASHKLFEESLYEEAGDDLDAFNFNLHDEEAPHQPFRIRWSRAFLEYSPLSPTETIDRALIDAAFGHFLDGAELLVLGDTA